MCDTLSLEKLLAAQRKEKKELIAQTQRMKHSVPKGEKKKKKEVTVEIAQLLANLDVKHEAQLKELENGVSRLNGVSSLNGVSCLNGVSSSDQKSESSDDIDKHDHDDSEAIESFDTGNDLRDRDGDHNGKLTQRVSKAQKRRNKKAALERERNKAIAEQEVENLSGLRHIESEQIKKKLSERNLTIHEIVPDGNCLYKAVEHQLSILNLKAKTVQMLREEASQYMLSHMDDFLPFLTCPETGDVLTKEMYVKYCGDIAKTTAWGGHIEIQALSQACGLPIEVIQAEGPSVIAGNENNESKLILSYHRHVFELGEHYNSVIPVME